jgi:hypothetical protein
MQWRALVVVASAGLALAACPASSPHGGGTPGVTTQVVGPKGADVTTPDGVTVHIPPGALSADTPITVVRAPNAPALPSATPAAGPTFLFGPEGTFFAIGVVITLPVDPSLLPTGITVHDVRAMTSPRDMPTYTPVDARPLDATHVQLATRHFSYFTATIGLPPDVCAACSKPSFDACLGCGEGFHFFGPPLGAPCLLYGTNVVGIGGSCRQDCIDGTSSAGAGYTTDCGYWCARGYHAARVTGTAVLGCQGALFQIDCDRDQGPTFDSCDWDCPAPYVRQGSGLVICTDVLGEPSDLPTSHCVLPAGATASCADGGTPDAGALQCVTATVTTVVCPPPGPCPPPTCATANPTCPSGGLLQSCVDNAAGYTTTCCYAGPPPGMDAGSNCSVAGAECKQGPDCCAGLVCNAPPGGLGTCN